MSAVFMSAEYRVINFYDTSAFPQKRKMSMSVMFSEMPCNTSIRAAIAFCKAFLYAGTFFIFKPRTGLSASIFLQGNHYGCQSVQAHVITIEAAGLWSSASVAEQSRLLHGSGKRFIMGCWMWCWDQRAFCIIA